MEADAKIVPATMSHVSAVAATMRPEDAAEVLASCGFDPLRALRESVQVSDAAWTLLLDGQPAAVFGAVGVASGCGVVWMLTSTMVDRHPIAFLRLCRPVVEALLMHYGLLFNYVDARYEVALRWARWLGFTVSEPEPFGVAGLPFCRIEMGG